MIRLVSIVAAVVALAPAPLLAQGWQVTSLNVGGVPAEVAQVELRLSKTEAMQPRVVRLRDTLADGSELKAPAAVEIELLSPGRVKALKEPGDSATLLLTSSGKGGESVEVKRGRWGFARLADALSQALDPFSASAGSAVARTKATEFTVAVDEVAGVARFRVQQGRIQVTQPVQLLVGDAADGRARSQRLLLAAGDPELSLPLSPAGWLYRFGNYDQAMAAFEAQVREAEARQDADAAIDALMALGDMRVLAGRAQEALAPFARALALVDSPDDAYWKAVLLGRTGSALQTLNRHREAARAYRDSLALHEGLPRREGEWTVEEQSTNIVLNLLTAGTYRCADVWAERLLRRLDDVGAGPARHIRAPLWSARGTVALALKREAQARDWHRRALDAERTLAGVQPNKATPGLVAALNLLGIDETRLNDTRAAEQLHREALALVDTLFSAANPLKADTHLGLAELQRARSQPAAAMREVQAALAVLDALPADDVRQGGAFELKAELLADGGSAAEAVEAYREARARWARIWPDASHPSFHTELLPGLARALRSSRAPDSEVLEAQAAARAGALALQQHEAECSR